MKTRNQFIIRLFLAVFLFSGSYAAMSQEASASGAEQNTIRIDKPFEAIEVSGNFRVFLIQGDEQKVVAESPEVLKMEDVVTVEGNTLTFHQKGIKQPDKLKLYVTFKTLNDLECSGASNVKGMTPVQSAHFDLEASGACKLELELNCSDLKMEASGASEVKLSGKTSQMTLEANGASNVKAMELEVLKASMEISGASKVTANVKEEIRGEASGASKLILKSRPANLNFDASGVSKIYINDDLLEDASGSTETKIKTINGTQIITIDEDGVRMEADSGEVESLIINDDGVKMVIKESENNGKKTSKVLVINDEGVKVVEKDCDGNKGIHWKKKNKFNGHWAGFDLGINGLVDKDFNNVMPAGYDYLDLRMEKSINVKINFFEQNVNLIKNHFGLVTGLGLEYANYRFDDKVILVSDSSNLYGYYGADPTKSYEKSKLVVNYLNLPLLFEYQTNAKSKANSFHIAAGMVLGWRYNSHSKNIISGAKIKDHDDFSMETFKYDATARIGWGVLNLNASYSLNTLFKKEKGPELYPFTVSLTLVNFM